MNPDEYLDRIAKLLNGQEWDSDTMSAIAEIIRESGREVKDLAEREEAAP